MDMISSRKVENWLKYIDYGLNPELLDIKKPNEKYLLMRDIIFNCLIKLIGNDKSKLLIINKVKEYIIKYDSELEILYLEKETNSYKVKISYQILPLGNKSCAFVTYLNKISNKEIKIIFLELKFYDDLNYLIDSITLKNDMLILNPKKNYKSPLCLKTISLFFFLNQS
jgi:hypothetical protein